MNKTPISYVDYTWNPVTGCLHPCRRTYCYNTIKPTAYLNRYGALYFDSELNKIVRVKCWASRQGGGNHLAQRGEIYPYGFDPTLYPHRLSQPCDVTEPSTVFVCDCADLWGRWVPTSWKKVVLKACNEAPQHEYIFLTKNPSGYLDEGLVFPKKHMKGLTLTNQKDAVTHLMQFMVKVEGPRWLSLEPLLGAVDLSLFFNKYPHSCGMDKFIKRIVVGGQTGPDAKSMSLDWVNEIERQCEATGTEFIFKAQGDTGPLIAMMEEG